MESLGKYATFSVATQDPPAPRDAPSTEQREIIEAKERAEAEKSFQKNTEPGNACRNDVYYTPDWVEKLFHIVRRKIDKDTSKFPKKPGEVILVYNQMAFKMKIDQLMSISGYFATCLKPGAPWADSSKGYLEIISLNSAAFGIFTHWVKARKLTLNVGHVLGYLKGRAKSDPVMLVGNENTTKYIKRNPILDLILDCWLLGDYLVAPGFQNAIMDVQLQLWRQLWEIDNQGVYGFIPLEYVKQIREHPDETSPLRRLMVDSLYLFLSDTIIRKCRRLGLVSRELAQQVAEVAAEDGLATRFMGKQHSKLLWHGRPCYYHVHPMGDFNSTCNDANELPGILQNDPWKGSVDGW